MDAPESLELQVLEPWDHSKHALLLGPLHTGLKADHVEGGSLGVFLAKLNDGVRDIVYPRCQPIVFSARAVSPR